MAHPDGEEVDLGRKIANVVAVLLVGGLGGYWLHRPAPAAPAGPAGADTSVARGAYLAQLGGCDDCHTPPLPDGKPDLSRRFSGYPAGAALPPDVPGVVTNLNLAWRGPWGLSETRNITPDPVNGIGSWTREQFIQAMRTAVNPAGRAIQPPMPAVNFGRLTDADLTALYNFLRTVKPSSNAVVGP
ncbi:MAG TPA: hypothetical protein VMV31_10765 [Terriglobales bacterium]|nr:hypothetical protein [Terriglobales bacterium]